MILISHRGNINGINKSRENSIEYIYEALNEGYDVEIDVWYKGGEWFLGHDGPENYVVLGFLKNDKLWYFSVHYMHQKKQCLQFYHWLKKFFITWPL